MKSFEERLEAESRRWVEDQVITTAQRDALLARHPVDAASGRRFVAILATIGGSLVAAGIGLLISANWREIGDWVKIAGLLALLVGAHVTGWRLRIAPGNYPKTGEAFFLLGGVLFLLGIALVSQIFHLNSRPPNGVLLWWAGVALLPWLVRVKSLQFLSVVALLIWLGMEFDASDSWLRLHPGEMFYGRGEVEAAAFFLIGGTVFFSGLALRGGRYEVFAGLQEKLGLVVMNVSLYVLTFAWSQYLSTTANVAAHVAPFVVFGVAATTAVGLAWWRNGTDVRAFGGWAIAGVIAAAGFVSGFGVAGERWWWGFVACLALFLLNIGMIRVGLATGRESWINLGVGFVALNILTRYLDLFGSMLDGGIFFVVTGAIVLALGIYLERKRRSLVAKMRKDLA